MLETAPRWRALALVAAMGLVVATSGALRSHAHSSYAAAQTYDAVYYLPPPGWLKVFSLGWDEAAADLIWMRALVYFGEEFAHEGSVEHVFSYAEAMLALDPDFRAVYGWVGVAGLYRPVGITPPDVERAVAIMERGAERFPEDGELAWDIGASLAFELAPILTDPADKDAARERAMPYLMRAVRLGAAPDWMALTNTTFLMQLGQTEHALRHLEEMYSYVEDPRTRQTIADRIASLRERAQADAFVESMRQLEEDRRRDFPYLPADLDLLVGPRPPVDLEAPISRGLPRALSGDATPTFPGPPP